MRKGINSHNCPELYETGFSKRSAPQEAQPQLPQDVEEFIARHAYTHASFMDTISPESLRAWMSGHVRVPVEPTEAMIDAGVAMALQVSVSGQGGWSEYVRALYTQMLNASKAEPQPEPDLWCVHILGPDDLYAAPSKAYAEVAADLHNRRFADLSEKLEVVCRAVVSPWPYSAESHAEDVASFIDDWFMPEPIVSQLNASKGE